MGADELIELEIRAGEAIATRRKAPQMACLDFAASLLLGLQNKYIWLNCIPIQLS